MPVADVRLMLIEATELAGMLTFTNQWLAGPDREQLAASLSSFVGTDAYRLTEQLTDLPCFTVLPGNVGGGQLFGGNRNDRRCDDLT